MKTNLNCHFPIHIIVLTPKPILKDGNCGFRKTIPRIHFTLIEANIRLPTCGAAIKNKRIGTRNAHT